jgi:hypothetical protein
MRQTSITQSRMWSCGMRTLAHLAATAGVLLLTSAEVCAQAGSYTSAGWRWANSELLVIFLG